MFSEGGFPFPRRRALDLLLGTGVVAFLAGMFYPVLRFLLPSKFSTPHIGSVRVGKTSEVEPNSGKHFRFGKRVGLLVRTPAGEFRAFDAECTHLSCTVQYRSDLEHIWCACHNGHFDLVGRNIAGPPPRPLTQLKVAVRGDEIFVTRQTKGG